MFFLHLLFFAQSAYADPTAIVWTRSPSAVRPLLSSDKYQMEDAEWQRKRRERSGRLPIKKRDALFHKLRMELLVFGWDELDKDVLIMTARVESPELLKKNYPHIPLGYLRALKNELSKMALEAKK